MVEYYKKKEEYQQNFLRLEEAMEECFRAGDNVSLEEVNRKYKDLLEEYKKFILHYFE